MPKFEQKWLNPRPIFGARIWARLWPEFGPDFKHVLGTARRAGPGFIPDNGKTRIPHWMKTLVLQIAKVKSRVD